MGNESAIQSRQWRSHGIALALLLAYLSPYFLLGQDAYLRIDDNLDSNLVWFKVLAASGKMFASGNTLLPELMGGLPRIALSTEWSYLPWLFVFFSPFTAYVVNIVFIHCVAYCGAFRLLQDHFFPREQQWLAVGSALYFALLPFWPMGALSGASMPLVLWAFLNLRSSQRLVPSMVIMMLVPLCARFVLSYAFAFVPLFLCAAYDLWKRRGVYWHIYGLLISTSLFIAAEYRLFAEQLLGRSFVSHRVETVAFPLEWIDGLRKGWDHLLKGNPHVRTLPTVPIALLCIAVVAAGKRLCKGHRLLWGSLGLLLMVYAYYGVYNVQALMDMRERFFWGEQVNLSRFYWLAPVAWLGVVAGSARVLRQAWPRWGVYVLVIALCAHSASAFLQQEHILYAYGEKRALRESRGMPTFRQFYAEDLYAQMKQDLPTITEARVLHVGMHPLISAYNGLQTFDSYQVLYPLEHKQRFRRIIADELARSDARTRWLFDGWGNRCYAFSSELGYRLLWSKHMRGAVRDLQLNAEALRDNDIHFIIAPVKIYGPERFGFTERGWYESPQSYWRLHVYQRD